MDFYLTAFGELNSCRNMGMGLSPIPFTSIWEYSRIYDIEDFDEFLYVIRVMDYKILDLHDKQTKRDAQVKGAKANNGGTTNKTNPNKGRR